MSDKDLLVIQKYESKRRDARRRGLDFNLSILSFINLCSAKKCHYTGSKLVYGKKQKPLQFCIDRVDPKKGYVKGNVVACSTFANTMKSQTEHEEDFCLKQFKKDVKVSWKERVNKETSKSNKRIIMDFYTNLGYSRMDAKFYFNNMVALEPFKNYKEMKIEELKSSVLNFYKGKY